MPRIIGNTAFEKPLYGDVGVNPTISNAIDNMTHLDDNYWKQIEPQVPSQKPPPQTQVQNILSTVNAPTAEQQAEARRQQQQTIQYLLEQLRTGGQQQAARDQQRQYAEMLLNQAKGIGGPTAAQSQLQAALQKQQAQAASQAASIRGMNPVAAARLVAQQQAENAQQAANQSSTLRAQEMQSAQEQYAKVLSETRQADIDAQYKQSAIIAQLEQSLRSGDQDAINAAMNAAVNMRNQDLQYMTAQQRNEYDAKMAVAKSQLELTLQQNQQKFDQGIYDANAKKAEDAKAWALWMNVALAVAGAVMTVIPGLQGVGVATAITGVTGAINSQTGSSAAQSGASTAQAGAAIQSNLDAEKAKKEQAQKEAAAAAAAKAVDATSQVSNPNTQSKGGLIKGKASKPGDSEDNDTVPALLSPGEIVIPRSIALSKDADKRSAEFVRQLKKIESSRPNSKRSAMDKIAKLEAQIAALKSKSAKSRK